MSRGFFKNNCTLITKNVEYFSFIQGNSIKDFGQIHNLLQILLRNKIRDEQEQNLHNNL